MASPSKPRGRREFLRLAAVAGAGIVGAGGLGAAAAELWPRPAGAFGGPVEAGDLGSIKEGEVKQYPAGRFWLSRFHEPALNNREVLLALYWKCAHAGCTLPWKPGVTIGQTRGVFLCPCHGSVYTRSGQNFGGPAPRPLDIMAITLRGRRIVVETGKRTQRVQYDPHQATVIS